MQVVSRVVGTQPRRVKETVTKQLMAQRLGKNREKPSMPKNLGNASKFRRYSQAVRFVPINIK